MGNTTLVPTKTKQIILEKTPEQYIKKRQGRGGTILNYVETGYVIKKLNEAFNYMWSFEVIEQVIGQTQVYVKGKLTAHLSPEVNITKVQYGGKDIARWKDGKPIDIGDDLKAASSDALKKCASLFGIAEDVFWPNGKEYDDAIDDGTESLNRRSYVDEDGIVHEPIENGVEFTTQPQNALQKDIEDVMKEEAIAFCDKCGLPTEERSGIAKSGRKWRGIFCSSKDKSHTKFIYED